MTSAFKLTSVPLLLILMVVLYAIVCIIPIASEVPMNTPPDITVVSIHADVVHSMNAERGRNACRQYGFKRLIQSESTKFGKSYHFICIDSDGTVYDWITKFVDGRFYEKTVYEIHERTNWQAYIARLSKAEKLRPWVNIPDWMVILMK